MGMSKGHRWLLFIGFSSMFMLAAGQNIKLLVSDFQIEFTREGETNGVHYEYSFYYALSNGASTRLLRAIEADLTSAEPTAQLGHLVKVESPEENRMLQDFATPLPVFLPLRYNETAGALLWPDGQSAMYNNLAPGQTLRDKDLFLMDSCDGLWYAIQDYAEVVRGLSSPVLINELPAPSRGAFRLKDSYYRIETKRTTDFLGAFPAAHSSAFLSFPGKLVTIDSSEENRLLTAELIKAGIDRAFTAGVHEDGSWAWHTPKDDTRQGRTPLAGVDVRSGCRPSPIAGVYQNFQLEKFKIACLDRDTFLGLELTSAGDWEAFFGSVRTSKAYIIEYASVRDYSEGTIHIGDKILRLLAHSASMDDAEIMAKAESLGGRKGRLPTLETFAEQMALGQLFASTLGCSNENRSANLGTLHDVIFSNEQNKWVRAGGLFAGVPYVPDVFHAFVRNFNGFDLRSCFATQGPRIVSNCYPSGGSPNSGQPDSLGMAVVEFDLNEHNGSFFRELPVVVTASGLLQMSGDRVGSYYAHPPTPTTDEELAFWEELVNRNAVLGTLTGALRSGDKFFYPDGLEVPRLDRAREIAVFSVADGCMELSFDSKRPFKVFRARSCQESFRVGYLEYSMSTAPDQLDVCTVSCTCTDTKFTCSGLTKVPVLNTSFTEFRVQYSSFPYLDHDSFVQYPDLEALTVSQSLVETVSDVAFQSNTRLLFLDLQFNYLVEIPQLNYTFIRAIDLSNNQIVAFTTDRLPNTTKTLNVERNFITQIDEGAFNRLTNLELIQLGENCLMSIHENSFFGIPQAIVNLEANPCDCAVNRGVVSCPTSDCLVETFARPAQSASSTLPLAAIAAVAVIFPVAVVVLLLVCKRRGSNRAVSHLEDMQGGIVPMQTNQLLQGAVASFPQPLQFSAADVTLDERLGSGEYGVVYRGVISNGPRKGTPCAVKTLNKLDRHAQNELLQEARIMAGLSHPNLVHLVGVCVERQTTMVLLELMPKGDLKSYLAAANPDDHLLQSYGIQVARALGYLAQLSIVHRDVAARNVLVADQLNVKLADLGMSRALGDGDYYRKVSSGRVPLKWMAPESIADRIYGARSDVWSYGVLLWEIWSRGQSPYPGIAAMELVPKIIQGFRMKPPEGTPDEIARVMGMCWHHNPRDRPSFQTLIQLLSNGGELQEETDDEEESVL